MAAEVSRSFFAAGFVSGYDERVVRDLRYSVRIQLQLVGLLLSLVASPCVMAAQTAREVATSRMADGTALLRADSLLGAAWDAKDVAAVLMFYDDNALVQWPDDSLRGKPELQEHLTKMFRDPAYRAGGSLDHREMSRSGDLAYAVGKLRYRRTARAAEGAEEVQGAWVVVWRWTSGGWRIVAEMAAAGSIRRIP